MNTQVLEMTSRNQSAKPGFSMLELLLVITLIGVIAGFLIERVSVSSEMAKVKTCSHNRSEINSAIERYNLSNGSFPATLSDLETTEYFPAGIPTCPLTGSAYSLNSTVNRVDGHTTTTSPGDH